MRTVVWFNDIALEERLQLNFIEDRVQSLVTAATPQKEIPSSGPIKKSRLVLYMFWLCVRRSKGSRPTAQTSCKCWSLSYLLTFGEDYTQVGFSPVKTQTFNLRVLGSSPCSGVPLLEQLPGLQTHKRQASSWTPSSPTKSPFSRRSWVDPLRMERFWMGTELTRAGRFRDGTDHLWSSLSTTTEQRQQRVTKRAHSVLKEHTDTLTHSTHTSHTLETLMFVKAL